MLSVLTVSETVAHAIIVGLVFASNHSLWFSVLVLLVSDSATTFKRTKESWLFLGARILWKFVLDALFIRGLANSGQGCPILGIRYMTDVIWLL